MKRISSLLLAGIALAVTTQAYAVMPSDAVVNRVNAAFRSGTIGGGGVSPQLGGSGGGGGTLNPVCNGSPENATVLLAVISGVGLLLGRSISRSRAGRLASAETV